ncbi:MAG: HAMP domain-containing sensor histidine kinase [Bacteroidota bacterium]|nr:HAMP domain-containing sensor histidine kinase [Bacteroidota bacterium]
MKNIYNKTQRWKYLLLVFALAIGVSSLFVTNQLVKELKKEEKRKIELWAQATKQLVSISNDGDYSLAIKVISDNNNIPVILVDECDSVLEYRNILSLTKIDSLLIKYKLLSPPVINNTFLRKELNYMKSTGDTPIEINFIGDKQWIFYKDSLLLTRLKYYPFYQLTFIAIFMLIAYLTFSASRKSEQNQVWAGMAKETAHQIGTPLSSLIAWLEMLKGKEGVQDMVSEMQKDVKRLGTITDRFSKIGSKPELKSTNIIALIENSIFYLSSRLPESVKFKFNFKKDSLYVPVNSVLLQWVIENICKNAVDAMINAQGNIKLEIIELDKKILIDITDNGKGISKKMSKTIFKPGVTSKKRGWGLGLSLSKRIMKYHNGDVFVKKSEGEQGSTFCISLPKDK